MGVDLSKEIKTDVKHDQLKLSQLSPSSLLRLKALYDKNPLNTSFDRRKLISTLNCGKKETDIIFEYFDMDENGVIDSYEFICAVAMLNHSSVELRAEFLFRLYDIDNDNYLSHDELANLVRNFLISQKKAAFYDDVDRKTEKVLKEADMDLDNKISLKEFQFYLSKNNELIGIFNNYSIISNTNINQNFEQTGKSSSSKTNEIEVNTKTKKPNTALSDEEGPQDNGFDQASDGDLEEQEEENDGEASEDSQKNIRNNFQQEEAENGDEMDPDLYNELNKDKIAEEKNDEDALRIKEGAEFTLVSDNGLFKVDQVQSGTEFSACKPWKGVVLNSVPSDYKPSSNEASEPDASLELEFIHGYRCHDTRNNLRFVSNGDLVYHSAAVGIVFNKESRTQKFYFDHIDDITALAIHPNKRLIATGEIGPYPLIGVWDAETMECLVRINGPLQKGINHLCFSKCGKYLAASAADDEHNIAIFDWAKGSKAQNTANIKSQKQKAASSINPVFASGKGPRANIMGICFNNQSDTLAVPCVKEVNFVSFANGTYKMKKGTGLKGDTLTTITCSAYLNNTLVCGTYNGNLVLFAGNSVSKNIKGHSGTVNSIWIRENNKGFLTGGNDSMIFYWDAKFNIVGKVNIIEKNINSLNPRIRSLCESENGVLLIGTRAGEIIELDGNTALVHMRGHFDKELWALTVHPKRDKYYTAGEDFMLAMWDIKTRTIEKYTKLNQPVKLMCISPDAKYLALGCDNGELYIHDASSLQMKLVKKDRKNPISEIKFSPNGQYLAVGCVDFLVFIYDVSKNFTLLKKMKGHVSRVTHMDFSQDSEILQSNSTSYDLLYHSLSSGKQLPSGASSFRDEKWATWTCVIGWPAQGIWPPCASGDDINAVDRDKKHKVLVTADDFGKVKLFRYPCATEKASFKKFIGHSSHVTCVRFTQNDNYLISTGGNDKSIFQWKYLTDEEAEEELEQYHEIDEAENNPDPENDVLNFKEDEMEFGDEGSASKPYLGEVKASTPKNFVVSKTAGEAPKESLKLKYVFGYRAFDTRMNVKYTSEGKIVYHTAAVGVVLDKNLNEQSFFTNHDEDMVCLAIHPNLKIVATGQMAKAGKAKLIDIYIWEIDSKKVLANLKGFHLRAIRNLAFSPDGTSLLSNGQDDDNSIAIYDWANSKILATSPVDKARVTDLAFKTNNEFVSIGIKHLKVWTLNGRNLTSAKGIFGSIPVDSLICMTFAFDNKTLFTGDSKGNMILWNGRNATKSIKAHNGSCFVLYHKNNMLYSGGQDGLIKIFNNKLELKDSIDMTKMTSFNPGIRSIDMNSNNSILVGLKGGDIVELTNKKPKTLMQSHSDNELWALSVNPLNPFLVVSGGGDNTIRVWDIRTNKQIKHLILDQDFRAVDWSADGSFLVAGSMAGKIYYIPYDSFTVKCTYQSIFKTEKQWIQELKISPDSNYVAYGAHGGVSKVEVLSVNPSNNKNPLTQYAIINPRFTSALTHLDWSEDSNYVVCNSLAFELKFLNISAKNLIAASASANIEWNTWTCLFGFPVQGIWPPESTNYVVNYTCMSNNKKVLATADDFSLVKLFKYPCVVEKAKYKAFSGHSSHVCKIRFSKNDLFLISVGGNDKSVFIWETNFGTPFDDNDDFEENEENEEIVNEENEADNDENQYEEENEENEKQDFTEENEVEEEEVLPPPKNKGGNKNNNINMNSNSNANKNSNTGNVKSSQSKMNSNKNEEDLPKRSTSNNQIKKNKQVIEDENDNQEDSQNDEPEEKINFKTNNKSSKNNFNSSTNNPLNNSLKNSANNFGKNSNNNMNDNNNKLTEKNQIKSTNIKNKIELTSEASNSNATKTNKNQQKASADRNEIPISSKKNNNQMFLEEAYEMGDQAINNVSEQPNWLKSIEAPDWAAELNSSLLNKKPKSTLKLDFVYGYRTRDTRNNLRYISENKIVYHCGFYGIVHDLKTNTQKIFAEHNDDIISMAVNNTKNLIATGENGSKSQQGLNQLICVWDEDCNLITKFEGNFFKGINSLNFSPESNFLMAISLNDEHDIYLFDIKENRMVATSKGGPTKILDCVFKNEKEFVTVGIKHFKYWMIKNGNIYAKDGFFGQCDNKLGLVVCHNGNFISGSANGELTVWRDEVIILNKKCHLKNVDSLYCKDEYILSGGRDYTILILDKELNELRRISLETTEINSILPIPRSLEFGFETKSKILLGTLASEVFEVNFTKNLIEGPVSFNPLIYNHYSLSNTENNRISAITFWERKNLFISVSEDCTLRLWDTEKNKQIDYIKLDVDNKGNKYKSDKGNINKAVALHLHKDENDIAIGFIDGAVRIYTTIDFKISKIIKFREKQITDVKFSPCGIYLAIASMEGYLDIYDSSSYIKKFSLKGNSGYITNFDWSTDTRHIAANYLDGDLIYFNTEKGTKISDSEVFRNILWSTNSRLFAWDIQGILKKDEKELQPRNIDVFNKENQGEKICSVGYDDGSFKIFRYPCIGDAASVSYKSHTQKIDSLKFSGIKQVLMTSSSDGCICKWVIQ